MTENPWTSPEQPGTSLHSKKSPMFSWLGCGLMVAIGMVLVGLMFPATRNIREPARRAQCQNNLKQIALALHNYEARYGSLPPAYTVDDEGNPLHSWRTLLLPYLEQQALFDSIDFSKPWNDPANAKALNTSVPTFMCPSIDVPDGHTTYMAVVAPNSCFRPDKPVKPSDIVDGMSTTLLVIEVSPEQSVPWMSPNDIDEDLLLALWSGVKLAHTGNLRNGAIADGSVRTFDKELSADEIRALISIDGDDNEFLNTFHQR